MMKFDLITFDDFKWINEPKEWKKKDNVIIVKSDLNTDFWQGTYYNFHFNSGHIFALQLKHDFTMEMCIEADFKTLYDQAGLMIYTDEKHWLKAGIEYNDGQPMIGSVLTNGISDWAAGLYSGDPRKFWIRLSKVKNVVCVKYSTDNIKWHLLRLAPFVVYGAVFVGAMCCTPKRGGLEVKFSGLSVTKPAEDILHSN